MALQNPNTKKGPGRGSKWLLVPFVAVVRKKMSPCMHLSLVTKRETKDQKQSEKVQLGKYSSMLSL